MCFDEKGSLMCHDLLSMSFYISNNGTGTVHTVLTRYIRVSYCTTGRYEFLAYVVTPFL